MKLDNANNIIKNNLLIKGSEGVINAFIVSTNTIALAGPILSESNPPKRYEGMTMKLIKVNMNPISNSSS